MRRGGLDSQGLEFFLNKTHAEERLFPELLYSSGMRDIQSSAVEHLPVGKRRNGGFLLSVAVHLFIVLLLIVEPAILAPDDPEHRPGEDPERLVLFMDDPPQPEATLIPVLPGDLAQEVPQDRLLIPRATRPPPPDKRQDFQNDLPFSEGNTDEFVNDEETEDPGEEGEPGEEADEEIEETTAEEIGEGDVEGEDPGSSETKLANLLPMDRLLFLPDDLDIPPPLPQQPQTASRPPPPPRADNGEGGEGGEGGAFEDIRRFLQDKRFDNPEGGLVTGLGRTMYYNDKGADFVPWIRRMLAEVRRNFMMPYSASFLAGHVAVGVVVDRNGNVGELKLIIPSGTAGFDNAAVGSLRAADLLPLPSDYPDQRFEFILVFWINEQPYELF